MQNDSWLPKLLFVAYVAVFVLLGVQPYDRAVWIAENVPIVAIAALLALLYWRRVRFSNLAYTMMAVLLF